MTSDKTSLSASLIQGSACQHGRHVCAVSRSSGTQTHRKANAQRRFNPRRRWLSPHTRWIWWTVDRLQCLGNRMSCLFFRPEESGPSASQRHVLRYVKDHLWCGSQRHPGESSSEADKSESVQRGSGRCLGGSLTSATTSLLSKGEELESAGTGICGQCLPHLH